MRIATVIGVVLGLAAVQADDLVLARSALDDGLRDIALASAEKALKSTTNAAEIAEARCIVLDALLDRAEPAAALARLESWPDAKDEAFRYRRAVAESACGHAAEARAALAAPFVRTNYVVLAKRLDAYLAARERVASGDRDGALRLLKSVPATSDASGEEVMFYASELMEDGEEARRLREKLAKNARRPEIRRRVAVKLGLDEIKNPPSFARGMKRIHDAVRSDPDAPESLPASLELAQMLLEQGDAEHAAMAEKEYAYILETYPQTALDAETLEKRAWALRKCGRPTDAIGAFLRASQAATNDVLRARCACEHADTLFEDGRYADAAQAYAKLAAVNDGFRARALFAAGDAYERASLPEKAREAYAALAAEPGAYRVRAVLRLASASAAEGRLDEAERSYGAVLEDKTATSAERITAYMGRGRVRYRGYRFAAAAEDFKAVVALDSGRAEECAFLRVLCLYGEGRDAEARKDALELETATSNAVLRADVSRWLARFDYNRGNFAEAGRRYEAYAAAHADDAKGADALVWAARAAIGASDFTKAVEFVSAAVTSRVMAANAPFRAEALTVQGEALMELARFSEAVAVYGRAADAARSALSGPTNTVVSSVAVTARRAGFRRADALFAMGADNAACWRAACDAYRELVAGGQLTFAERLRAAFQIGRALEKLGLVQEAEKQYYTEVVHACEKAWEKGEPADEETRTLFSRAAFALADLCESHGDVDGAGGVLGRVVSSGVPAAEEAMKRLDYLESKGYRR